MKKTNTKTVTGKKVSDVSYGRAFVIREGGKWTSGISHSRRTLELELHDNSFSDKDKIVSLLKLADFLYSKIEDDSLSRIYGYTNQLK